MQNKKNIFILFLIIAFTTISIMSMGLFSLSSFDVDDETSQHFNCTFNFIEASSTNDFVRVEQIQDIQDIKLKGSPLVKIDIGDLYLSDGNGQSISDTQPQSTKIRYGQANEVTYLVYFYLYTYSMNVTFQTQSFVNVTFHNEMVRKMEPQSGLTDGLSYYQNVSVADVEIETIPIDLDMEIIIECPTIENSQKRVTNPEGTIVYEQVSNKFGLLNAKITNIKTSIIENEIRYNNDASNQKVQDLADIFTYVPVDMTYGMEIPELTTACDISNVLTAENVLLNSISPSISNYYDENEYLELRGNQTSKGTRFNDEFQIDDLNPSASFNLVQTLGNGAKFYDDQVQSPYYKSGWLTRGVFVNNVFLYCRIPLFGLDHYISFNYQTGGQSIDVSSAYTITFDTVLVEVYQTTNISPEELEELEGNNTDDELPGIEPPFEDLPNIDTTPATTTMLSINFTLIIIVIVIICSVGLAVVFVYKKKGGSSYR